MGGRQGRLSRCLSQRSQSSGTETRAVGGMAQPNDARGRYAERHEFSSPASGYCPLDQCVSVVLLHVYFTPLWCAAPNRCNARFMRFLALCDTDMPALTPCDIWPMPGHSQMCRAEEIVISLSNSTPHRRKECYPMPPPLRADPGRLRDRPAESPGGGAIISVAPRDTLIFLSSRLELKEARARWSSAMRSIESSEYVEESSPDLAPTGIAVRLGTIAVLPFTPALPGSNCRRRVTSHSLPSDTAANHFTMNGLYPMPPPLAPHALHLRDRSDLSALCPAGRRHLPTVSQISAPSLTPIHHLPSPSHHIVPATYHIHSALPRQRWPIPMESHENPNLAQRLLYRSE
jgi:hypothetical protein